MKYTKEYWDWNNSQDDLLIKRKTDNKLIAEFMGFAPDKVVEDIVIWHDNNMMMPQSVYDSQDGNCFDDLLFDKSWDWLMPVVKKCLVGEAEQSEEMSNTTIKNVYEGICNQDIFFAYKSVVEFINQHNIK